MRQRDENRSKANRRMRPAAVLIALHLAAATTLAAPAIYGGPGNAPIFSSGERAPTQVFESSQLLNNSGQALGIATRYDNYASQGKRAYRFGSGGTTLLPQNAGANEVRNPMINDAGTTVLTSGIVTATQLDYRVLRYAAGTTTPTVLHAIGTNTDGEESSFAYAINQAGTVVGGSLAYPSQPGVAPSTFAVKWLANSTFPVTLQPVSTRSDGVSFTYGTRINASGAIIAKSTFYSGMDDRGTLPVRYAANSLSGTFLESASTAADGTRVASASDFNNAGTAIGYFVKYAAGANDGDLRPARWNANTTSLTQLGILGTDTTGNSKGGVANDINTSNTSAGSVFKYVNGVERGSRAVRWTSIGSAATELPLLDGADQNATHSSHAAAINDTGTIVGGCDRTTSGTTVVTAQFATIWLANSSVATDLNLITNAANQGWRMISANGISDTGWITGTGTYDADGPDGFVPAAERLFTVLVPQAGTYGKGDANFDTVVNFDDLIILAQHYNQANAAQDVNVGDFNLDGVVNFDDLIPLAQHYGLNAGGMATGFSGAFKQDWALAQSLVPEPTALLGAAVCGLVACGRRSKR